MRTRAYTQEAEEAEDDPASSMQTKGANSLSLRTCPPLHDAAIAILKHVFCNLRLSFQGIPYPFLSLFPRFSIFWGKTTVYTYREHPRFKSSYTAKATPI